MTRLWTWMVILLASAASLQADSLAIVGGTIIDATGEDPLSNGTVLIEDGRIAAVGRTSSIRVPDSATTINAKGKYVIPGLMDANLHLFFSIIDLERVFKYEGRYDEMIIEAAQIALKTGQTTVFDTWGPRAPLVSARDRINAGEFPGARIFLAGNIIGFDGPWSADFMAQYATMVPPGYAEAYNEIWEQGVGRDLMWLGPAQVKEKVAQYAELDVDFLKYGASGHTDMFFVSFSERVQRAIVEAGHEAGMTVQAHTTSVESLDMAIEAGCDIITHCDVTGPGHPMPDEAIRKMAERGIACSVLPETQARVDAQTELNPANMMLPYTRTGRDNVRRMIEGGVTLLLSTDAGIMSDGMKQMMAALGPQTDVDPRIELGEGHFNVMVALEELGMTPMGILQSATRLVAEAYKLDEDLGTLEAGKIADVVILGKNPLEGARNFRSVETVIKDGKVVDIDALPTISIVLGE